MISILSLKKIHILFIKKTGLNCEYFIETNLYVEDENFRKSIENILRAFRIFSSGKLEVPCIFSTDFLSRMNVYPSYVKQEQLYKLNITDIPEIEELFNKIEKNNSNKLNIIFERFDSILSRFSSFKKFLCWDGWYYWINNFPKWKRWA